MNSTNPSRHIIYPSILLLLFVACYHSTLSWMYGRYMSSDSYYSHGFLIPFIAGFLIWQKREKLRHKDWVYCWWGLILIIASLLLHITGTLLYVFSISGFSIFLLIMGVSLFLFGRDITRTILFPLVLLLFMFPMPQAFISAISFPMKMLVAKVGVWIVAGLGIPVFREGFHIAIPAGNLLVGNPCSGLRSLISFLALGAVLAYLSSMSNMKKWILFVLAIPVALLSNIIRVPILIIISHYWGVETAAPDSFWHDASGVFVFAVGLIMLFYAGRLLEWKSQETDT